MALRVVVASAVVSREVGRGRHRLGAFFVGAARLDAVRRLLALVSAIIFVDALLFTALTPLVPSYAEEFDLSKTGAGLLVGAYGAGALFGGIPGGLAAARWGPKREVVGALLLLAVASFAFAAADSAVALGFARFVQGIASTATWAGALAWISVRRRASGGARSSARRSASRSSARCSAPCSAGVAEYAGIGLVVRARRRRHARLRGARGGRAVLASRDASRSRASRARCATRASWAGCG